MHMYGSEVWNLNYSYVDDFKWHGQKSNDEYENCIPCNTHNAIVQNLTYNIVET